MPKSKSLCYVYVLFRPDGDPCYVGKGSRSDRVKHHASSARAGKHDNRHLSNIIRKAGGEIPAVILHRNLLEDVALEYEKALIAAIGREANGGPLVNKTDGGEGAQGAIVSEETKAKHRASMVGRPGPTKGIKHTAEAKEGFTKGQRRRRQTELELGIDRSLSAAWKEGQSERIATMWAQAEYREKMLTAQRKRREREKAIGISYSWKDDPVRMKEHRQAVIRGWETRRKNDELRKSKSVSTTAPKELEDV